MFLFTIMSRLPLELDQLLLIGYSAFSCEVEE
jgi:hypothetical protein